MAPPGEDGKAIAHGGDLDVAERRFGVPAAGWLDLSTGINPAPYPLPEIAPESWRRLPQAAAEAGLIEAARACYGAPAAAGLVAAPGTQALIQLLPRFRPPGPVAVLGPTYAEHAHVWAAAGHDVVETATLAQASAAAVAVLVNPNNPDGRVIGADELEEARRALARRGGWLVVDEAFADCDPTVSMAAAAGRPGLILLRSFGKFFGLAGLRLGFALAEPVLARRLQDGLGPWAVAGPALEIGRTALADRDWIEATRARLAAAAARLDRLLAEFGLAVVGGTSLFRLAETPDAAALHEGLARHGILTRVFDGRPGLIRIGLPGADLNFDRLAAALAIIR